MKTGKPRERIPLLNGWKFRKGRARRWDTRRSSAEGFENVDLPHCVNTTDTFQEGIPYYRGGYVYLRKFSGPDFDGNDDSIWRIVSGGFYGTGDVFFNGKKLSDIDGQYLGFKLDVTGHLKPKVDNLIVLRLTNKCGSNVLPGKRDPDFLLYGGLSSEVFLEKLPSVHIGDDFFASSTVLENGAEAMIAVEFPVYNRSGHSREVQVEWTVSNSRGDSLARWKENILSEAGGAVNGRAEMKVNSPELWGPDNPYLYNLTGRIYNDGKLIDEVETRTGIRTAEFAEDGGFMLNGRKTFLAGINRHESMPGFGNALGEILHRKDAELIREMGLNFVRLSHYPQSPAFLRACDELGIMVYAEIASWKSVRTGKWLMNAKRQLGDMIRRDRNHPSVILWGLGNESRSREAYLELDALVKDLDPSRATIYAENHLYRARREETLGLTDVWGCNYELEMMEEGRNHSRLKSVVVSECSNYPNSLRGEMGEEFRQLAILDRDITWVMEEGKASGFAVWCFNDYATMRKKRYFRYSGVVDAWRVPKMSFDYLKARFSKEPVLSVFSHWGCRKSSGGKRRVIVVTNMGKVVVSARDEVAAELKGGFFHELEVDFNGGNLVVESVWMGDPVRVEIKPFGAASSVKLVADQLGVDGKFDIFLINVEIVDEYGRLVSDWSGDVSFDSGEGVKLMFYKPERVVDVSGGRGRLFVLADNTRGTVVLMAKAPLLKSCEVKL